MKCKIKVIIKIFLIENERKDEESEMKLFKNKINP